MEMVDYQTSEINPHLVKVVLEEKFMNNTDMEIYLKGF